MARETVFTEKTSWENKVTFMKTRLRKFFGDSVNQGVTQTFLYMSDADIELILYGDHFEVLLKCIQVLVYGIT